MDWPTAAVIITAIVALMVIVSTYLSRGPRERP
jgi:hypothetical protein